MQWRAWLLAAALGGAALAASERQHDQRRGAELQFGAPFDERVQACRRSGNGDYCSTGKTRSYVGLLDSAQNIKDALEATAYKKEIIIFAESRLSDAAHIISRMRSMAGYGHVLPVMNKLGNCRGLVHTLAPWTEEDGPLSCGAYSHEDEQ
jgi:hypothetical protein